MIKHREKMFEGVQLAPEEVHVWHTSLRLPDEEFQLRLELLSVEEKLRAERFSVERKYIEYVVTRGTLRLILGHVLEQDPAGVTIHYTGHDKPYVDPGVAGTPVCFNVSHSHELAVFAVTPGIEVGIDIEHVREDVEFEKMARRFFSTREAEELDTCRKPAIARTFFSCWTRKEAFVKATGKGIAFGLGDFSVSMDPDQQEVELHAGREDIRTDDWHIRNLDVHKDYACAVAVKGRLKKIHYHGLFQGQTNR